jgi:hypothetical protein
MKTSHALSAVFALVALGLTVGCSGKSSQPGGAETVTKTVTVTETTEPAPTATLTGSAPQIVAVTKLGPAPPKHRIEFGHIRSLVRSGDGFKMRFDPAQFLTGISASDAALEDTGSSDVPNDNYMVDESHRSYSYLVPADAHVSVLAGGVDGTSITVAELAKLVRGEDPLGHPLFEPLETGFWILFDVDTVRSLDQQYLP